MKWNGTVSHVGNATIATRFATANSAHATASARSRNGQCDSADAIEPVPLAADRRHDLVAQLRAQPPDVDVDDVRPRIVRQTPHRRQQTLLRDGPADVAHQLPEQQELAP